MYFLTRAKSFFSDSHTSYISQASSAGGSIEEVTDEDVESGEKTPTYEDQASHELRSDRFDYSRRKPNGKINTPCTVSSLQYFCISQMTGEGNRKLIENRIKGTSESLLTEICSIEGLSDVTVAKVTSRYIYFFLKLTSFICVSTVV